MDDLSQNEGFVTVALHATQAAIRNHQEEKLEALRNAVLNSTLPTDVEVDLQLMFIGLIDELTTWHVRILKLFDNPREYTQNFDASRFNIQASLVTVIVEYAYPELIGQVDFYRKIFKDLDAHGLTEIPTGLMSGAGMVQSRTTPIGKQFLKFISTPDSLK